MEQKLMERLREANSMIEAGDNDDAVRLSGELLATANEYWGRAHNEGRREAEVSALTDMMVIAATHVAALVNVKAYVDAYSTAVMVLFIAAREGMPQSEPVDKASLDLYTLALFSLLMTIQNIEPQSPSDIDHITTITRYVASMLYHYYNKLLRRPEAYHNLVSAYEELRQVMELVQIDTPEINVLEERVDPEYPLPLFADLIGRSRAMGLLEA